MHYVCTTWVLKSTARHWHWTSLQNAQQRWWNVLSCFCFHIFMLCTVLLTVAWFQVRNIKWEFLIHSHIYATAFYWLCCNRSTAQKIFEYYKPGNQTALDPYLLWNPNSKQLTTTNISPCWYCAIFSSWRSKWLNFVIRVCMGVLCRCSLTTLHTSHFKTRKSTSRAHSHKCRNIR